eukprot:CAMPEP_0194051192 /NCGR_PEP_ID=MMETSP0009_2-20130614/39106_1 /TAXON_ID=210454 /ORGANISM="Grammatophora oceanica, Strain CCMP 410" /LENGTH=117 /DNA_ID=CAMNT_0038698177 /DNA_START=1 /DNA_END=351 /DNA_ORIENTATION=+
MMAHDSIEFHSLRVCPETYKDSDMYEDEETIDYNEAVAHHDSLELHTLRMESRPGCSLVKSNAQQGMQPSIGATLMSQDHVHCETFNRLSIALACTSRGYIRLALADRQCHTWAISP